MVDEIITLKGLGVTGIGLYFATLFYKITMAILAKRSGSDESQIRDNTRQKIQDTKQISIKTLDVVGEIRKSQREHYRDFYEMKNENHEIHEVVTHKHNSGSPSIYNPELHDLIKDMNRNTKNLTEAIAGLAVKCKAIN